MNQILRDGSIETPSRVLQLNPTSTFTQECSQVRVEHWFNFEKRRIYRLLFYCPLYNFLGSIRKIDKVKIYELILSIYS